MPHTHHGGPSSEPKAQGPRAEQGILPGGLRDPTVCHGSCVPRKELCLENRLGGCVPPRQAAGDPAGLSWKDLTVETGV